MKSILINIQCNEIIMAIEDDWLVWQSVLVTDQRY
jgi:hypothetical protein